MSANGHPTNAQALMSLYAIQQAMCYRATLKSIGSGNSIKGCWNGIRRENRETSFRLFTRGQQRGCLCCGEKLSTNSTGDHLLALAQGGPAGAQNYSPLCARCNSSKGAREFFTWWARKDKSVVGLPADLLCAYARLWWQKHERDGTLDDPAPPALVKAVLTLRGALPLAQQWALYRAREASLSLAQEAA